MIEFENATRKYGDKVAVDDLNLLVPAGELFAFLGPNGAGKTTSIKMLVGLLRPTSGTVRVGGYDVTLHHREAASLLGYVPEDVSLYDKLTGREFLHFVAGMYGLDDSAARRSADRQIDAFVMGEFVDHLTESYSHGMRQRLAFAAALLHDPEVLVVDEPMVGLDPRTARNVKDLLRAQAAAGKTVFISTHSLSVAEEIADRLAILDRGRLRSVGTLEGLRKELASHNSSLEQMFLEATGGAASAGKNEPAAG